MVKLLRADSDFYNIVEEEFIDGIPKRIYDFINSLLTDVTGLIDIEKINLDEIYPEELIEILCVNRDCPAFKNLCNNNTCPNYRKNNDNFLYDDYMQLKLNCLSNNPIDLQVLEFSVISNTKVYLNQYKVIIYYNIDNNKFDFKVEQVIKYAISNTGLLLIEKSKFLNYSMYSSDDIIEIISDDDYFETIISYNSFLFCDNLKELQKTDLYKNTDIWCNNKYANKDISIEMITNGIINRNVQVNSNIR